MTFGPRIMLSGTSHTARIAICLLVGLSPILANRVDTVSGTRNDVILAPCPTNCSCANYFDSDAAAAAAAAGGGGVGGGGGGGSIVIDCSGRSIDDNTSFSVTDELDMFLMNSDFDLSYQLNVTKTSMTRVPSSVCRLSRLRKLFLSNNRLKILPKKCFDAMSTLEEFHATDNELTEIQEGVFDNLPNLKVLSLINNRIKFIGLRVFTAEANLTSLRNIWLSNNRLIELEPWPLIRGQLVPGSIIDLRTNRIVNITNQLNWSFQCGSKPPVAVNLNLIENDIAHLSDITDGWNIRGLANIMCFIWNKARPDLTIKVLLKECDCRDYLFYLLAHHNNKISWLDGQYCTHPDYLEDKKILGVPLDQFVCNVPYPVCPGDCDCVKIPYNRTYIVRCPLVNDLPISLPDTAHPGPYECRYSLEFPASRIEVINVRDYFNRTATLNVSGLQVVKVTNDAWRSLVRVSSIDLSLNQLTTLPIVLSTENLTYSSLALYQNPWRCRCEDRWMRDWMITLGSNLVQRDSVLCSSPEWNRGKSVLSLTDEQFCYDPARQQIEETIKTVVSTTSSIIVFVLFSVTTIVYRYRVAMFTRFKLHPFNVDECTGEHMIYDVFLSCAYEDRDVGRSIVDRLERRGDNDEHPPEAYQRSGGGGYRVCYHERDFNPGTLITENIQAAIEGSRRVVCLMTRDFVRSECCMMEFRAAWCRNLKLNKRRLVVIKWPDVVCSVRKDVASERTIGSSGFDHFRLPDEQDDANCAADYVRVRQAEADVGLFLSTHTYIAYDREDWWDQLLYALPISLIQPTVT